MSWLFLLFSSTKQSCKNVQTVRTSRCYFFLAGANFWEKHAKNCAILQKTVLFFGANFLGGKLVGANFYAICNYATKLLDIQAALWPKIKT